MFRLEKRTKKNNEILKVAKKVTDQFNIPLIINDNIDVAIKLNADGIHIGQNDISCVFARKILGKNKIIGVTVTTLEQAKKAIADGADYLGVGAIHKSFTKKDAEVVSTEELKKILKYSTIPIVVIGGINEKTIPEFQNTNVSGYAMIRPILQNKDIVKETNKLKKLIISNNVYNNY